jgi:predicted TIM-barrel fold metal-dependent hydrolase
MVSGGVDGRFLDHPSFDALLSVASTRGVPLYVHPGIPPEAVRTAYYSGFDDGVNRMLSTAAWGWHSETAIHLLRLVLAGAFERHPRLQVVVGHMGEMLPVMLDRSSALLSPMSGLPKSVKEYVVEHVSITIAGVYNLPAFSAAVAAVGIDRIMFSTDYPYGPAAPAMQFCRTVPLAPDDRRRLMSGNAAALLGLDVPRPDGLGLDAQ